MKDKNTTTPLVDEYLNVLADLSQPVTDAYFYTRLRARMDTNHSSRASLRPVIIIACLVALIVINFFTLMQQPKAHETARAVAIQQLADSYNISISSTY